jgi:predicted outer membrane repeat protein
MNVDTFLDADGQPTYYVVNLYPSGFVIVSADDMVEPIIAFADDGTFVPSLDNPLGALVSGDIPGRVAAARALQAAIGGYAQKKVPNKYRESFEKTGAKAQGKWGRLQDYADKMQVMGLSGISDMWVAPLVQSKWSQRMESGLSCYNYYTPPYAPNTPANYPCGCIATAMAQLMRFHEHPTAGIGVHDFIIKVDDVEEIASTRGGNGQGGPYDWPQMPLDPNSSVTGTQRQAIGALCYDAGISVNMNYKSSGSGSDTLKVKDALTTTFGYSYAVKGYNGGDNIGEHLNGMVNPNLDYGHPIILGITGPSGGHAVITDGYGYDFSTLYHHLNMGWAGTDDAWYNLPDINSSPSYTSIYKCVYNVFVSGSGEIISGRVTDMSGDPISAATVTAQGSGSPFTASTNSKGIYALAKVPSGTTFTVTVSKDGYTFEPPQIVTTATSGGSTPGNRWAINFQGTSGEHPVIQVSAEEIEFVALEGASNPEPQILTICNSGFGTLNWVIDYDCNWLEVDPCEGISTGDINEVTLSVDTTGMALGSYNCELTISDPCAFNNPKTIQVNLSIWAVLRVPTSEYPTIQAAIDAAADGCIIIVSEGTHTGPGNRDIDFLGKAITVRSENPNDPNIVAATIIDCNATQAEPHRGFYFHSAEGQSSILNGLTITKAYAPDDDGGGIFCVGASPAIENCIISGCTAGNIGSGLYNYGGGMSNKNSSMPTLTNCTFSDNSAQYGGGMHNRDSRPTLNNCTFSVNSAMYAGAMYNYNSSPTLTDCTISYNSVPSPAGGCAGAIYIRGGSSATLINCTISGNSGDSGGAIASKGNLIMTDCTFSVNTAGYSGGAIQNRGGNMMLTNCTFSSNSASDKGGAIYNSGYSTLTNCTFTQNSATGDTGYGGGMYNFKSNPTFNNCIFNGNWVDRAGGGIYNGYGSPTLTNCTFSGNSAGQDGGGMSNLYYGSPTLINCAFRGNSASWNGGGMNSRGVGDICRPTLINCTFDDNWAKDEGGGVRTYQSEIELFNCIFIRNSADDDGGGVEYSTYTSATMRNCTFVGNSSPYGRALACDSFRQESPSTVHVINCILWDGGNEIWNRDNSAIMVTYSNVQYGWPGTGNIKANPSFVTGPDGDYYLSQIAAGQPVDSPCVDAGSDTAANLGMDIYTTRTDQIGDAGIVDMGYHYPAVPNPDIDGNWYVDLLDYTFLAADWQNCSEESYLPGDITGDTCVNGKDLKVLAECWLDCFMPKATNPQPTNEARGVDPNRTLSWLPGLGALSHDVYFGTDADAVANADHLSPEFMGTVSEALFDPCSLELETTYYWRIDEVGPACTMQGEVWNFTTQIGLISWWKFDEGEGSIAYDSGGENDGTIYGAAWTSGQIGGALDFDGVDDYVDVGNDISLMTTSDLTIYAWIKARESRACIYSHSWSGFGLGFGIGNNNYDGRLGFYTQTHGHWIEAGGSLADDTWHQVAATLEGTMVRLYTDSIEIGSDTGTPAANLNGIGLIGLYNYDWFFGGTIDDVRIYDKALSANEIQELYHTGLLEGP